MKLQIALRAVLLLAMAAAALTTAGCTDDFYLSEKEVAAYRGALVTEASANLYFDNLQGRTLELQFDNSAGSPRLQSSNLLAEMRRTELAQLESGPAAVSLDRLRDELEKQIGHWIDGRLELYVGDGSDQARLTRLDSVNVRFLTNPTFAYRPEGQSIGFDVRLTITINGTVEVDAVNWLVNFFTSVNGTYPLQIVVNDLRLQGEASVLSPYANAGRLQFKLLPQVLGSIGVSQTTTTSVPDQVKEGIRDLLSHNLSVRVKEDFEQDYSYFALPSISLSSATSLAPSRLSATYRPKSNPYGPAESTDPLLHLVTRGADGKLYHARKSTGAWSTYTAVPMPSPSSTPYPRIDNDPTLVHSGCDQLELAATDAAGDLVYAHWRDETWGNWAIFRPNTTYWPPISYRGKPAVAASAPGQAEIIAEGNNGQLWHLRRLNGVWQTPAPLPQLAASSMSTPLHDPVAAYVGNKVMVLYVDGQNHLFGQVFDLEMNLWGQPALIQTQETIRYAPAAVTSGPGPANNVDVVYVGQSGAVYHRRLGVPAVNLPPPPAGSSGFSVSPESIINGTLNAPPILIASGYRQVELIGRGTDNLLRHNHFVNALAPFTVDGRTVNPGWQGWLPVGDNLSKAATTTDGRISEFAAAATPTGRVELAARGYVNPGSSPTQYIFHNNYESDRHGRAPWKTVQWRGYEVAGSQRFVGRPALAAVDRNFQIGFEGNTSGGVSLDFARLSASNLTRFTTGPAVRALQNPIDPVVLSTGYGITDCIYFGDDGRLHHDRYYGNGSGQLYTLSVPIGLFLTRQLAADSYGNGLIELAALASDGRIYHWRFRDGKWSAPVAVAGGMISSPVLLYTGAGQLELLAVDLDHKLFRWRFTGTGWGSRISVPSTFSIKETLFKPMSASSWGDGTVDLAVVDLDTQELHHRRIGPGDETCARVFGCPAPRVFSNLGGKVIEAPVLTAFSPVRLNILTMQGQLAWFSNWASMAPLQPITFPPQRDLLVSWSGFEDTGAREMVVGSAANSGRSNYAAVAIDFDGRILINRNREGRWTGFQPVIGQSPEMILRSPLVLPALAAHGG
ncbi:MAG TPA: hypothetical protein VKC34_18400 [Blastocatellia bacterium]|nr:hypothetical protein [Blastocatellia bacterium]